MQADALSMCGQGAHRVCSTLCLIQGNQSVVTIDLNPNNLLLLKDRPDRKFPGEVVQPEGQTGFSQPNLGWRRRCDFRQVSGLLSTLIITWGNVSCPQVLGDSPQPSLPDTSLSQQSALAAPTASAHNLPHTQKHNCAQAQTCILEKIWKDSAERPLGT